MLTPFYATKTTAITREDAIAEGRRLAARLDTSEDRDRQDLIDFCLGGTKTELVQLSLGAKVRMKASNDWFFDAPVPGTECVISQFTVSLDNMNAVRLRADDGDWQALEIHPHVTDLSEWLEVL